jgi:hypothetical protein
MLRHPGRRQKYEASIPRPIAVGESHHPMGQSAERGTGRHIDAAVHQHAATKCEQDRDYFKPGTADPYVASVPARDAATRSGKI